MSNYDNWLDGPAPSLRVRNDQALMDQWASEERLDDMKDEVENSGFIPTEEEWQIALKLPLSKREQLIELIASKRLAEYN